MEMAIVLVIIIIYYMLIEEQDSYFLDNEDCLLQNRLYCRCLSISIEISTCQLDGSGLSFNSEYSFKRNFIGIGSNHSDEAINNIR